MIECVQQVGMKNGVRQVFDFDKVYKVEGEGDAKKRTSLGICGHADTSRFHPRIPLTDNEKVEVVDAINAHRAKLGRKPIAGMTATAKTLGEIKQKVQEFVAQNEDEDDDE